MVITDKVTVTEFSPHIGKTTTDYTDDIWNYKENDMGVYIELPKEWAKWSLEVTDVHDNILEAKTTDIDLVRCGECEYADEYNHCKYSAWWNGNADFCSHGIRRKESR